MSSVLHLAYRPHSAPVTVTRRTLTATRRASSEEPRDVANTEPRRLSQLMFHTVSHKHMEIANHPFFTAMNDGTLTQDAYVRYLSDRLIICTALEEALRKVRPRLGDIGKLHFERRTAVIEDLTKLRCFPTEPSAAVRDLEARIEDSNSCEVIAHAWVEYMGMLNGGQGMKVKLRKLFGTAAFVTFDERASVLRDRYTQTLDALHMAGFERESMCEEASAAFDLHTAILDANMNPRSHWETNRHEEKGPSWWQTWCAAFAWVPRLFGAR